MVKPVFRKSCALLLTCAFFVGLAAACDPQVPSAPVVTVNITVVDDESALADGVAKALTSTAVQGARLTETQLAATNITLTPSPTPTPTVTPLPPTETPIVTPSATLIPSATLTPTFEPLASSTPAQQQASTSLVGGRMRIISAWRPPTGTLPYDVWIDNVPVARRMSLGSVTNYQNITATSVRITLRVSDESLGSNQTPPPPLLSRVVDIPNGSSVSVVIADLGRGQELSMTPIFEDFSPLASSRARLSLFQANPLLLRSNVLIPDLQKALAYNLALGQRVGPYDIPSGVQSITLYDADNPELVIDSISLLRFDSRIDYLLIFIPAAEDAGPGDATDYLLVPSSSGRTVTDVPVRFANAASSAGPLSIVIDGEPYVSLLGVGQTSVTVPVSRFGSSLVVLNTADTVLYRGSLPAWNDQEAATDKIVLLSDRDPALIRPGDDNALVMTNFSQNPRPSVLGSNIRLIHGLTGTTVTLDLQIRSTTPTVITSDFGVPQSQQADSSWSPVIRNVSFSTASDYVVRTPNVFDVRLVLSGTESVQASLNGLQLLAGGVYDFLALPGERRGVVKLILLEPDVQVTSLGTNQADPQLIQQQVEVILTASAPAITTTPTVARTPTPTISPVPTNTPRPSNTPGVAAPSLQINPAPPNVVYGSFILSAQGFVPDKRYTVNIDSGPENWSGSTGTDGRFSLTIVLPADLRPGLHVARVCVDCRPGGAQQEQIIAFKVADPLVTPTATQQP